MRFASPHTGANIGQAMGAVGRPVLGMIKCAEGMQCPWWWNGGMISLNLGVIWEMSPKIISAA